MFAEIHHTHGFHRSYVCTHICLYIIQLVTVCPVLESFYTCTKKITCSLPIFFLPPGDSKILRSLAANPFPSLSNTSTPCLKLTHSSAGKVYRTRKGQVIFQYLRYVDPDPNSIINHFPPQSRFNFLHLGKIVICIVSTSVKMIGSHTLQSEYFSRGNIRTGRCSSVLFTFYDGSMMTPMRIKKKTHNSLPFFR